MSNMPRDGPGAPPAGRPRPPPPPGAPTTNGVAHPPNGPVMQNGGTQGRPSAPPNSTGPSVETAATSGHATTRPKRAESTADGVEESHSEPSPAEAGPAAGRPPKRRRAVFEGARDIGVYVILEDIGEGAYGKVWKARDPQTGAIVALKMIKTMEKEGSTNEGGFPITSVREIKILHSLSHPNIVQLNEVVTDRFGVVENGRPGDVYMVFEYLDFDLAGLISSPKVSLERVHVKSYMKQLLEAVAYMHKNKILHRDLKCANLLVNADGALKLADWGFARSFYETATNHTRTIITLWYRPPEVLLRVTKYGPEVDMWSVGCIFGELLNKAPIMAGQDELSQLDAIFKLVGTPNTTIWPKVDELPDWGKISDKEPKESQLRKKFAHEDAEAVDLLEKMLTMDPSKRITAAKALDHPYFWKEPVAPEPRDLPKHRIASCHELDLKKAKEAKKKAEEEAAAQRRAAQQQHQGTHRGRGPPGPPNAGYGRGRGPGGRGWGAYGAGRGRAWGQPQESKGW